MVSTENLSASSLNLLKAGGIINFLLEAVSEQTSDLAFQIHEALIKRLSDRRHVPLMTLIQYLNNSSFFSFNNLRLKSSSKTAAQQLGIELMNRFFGKNQNDTNMTAQCAESYLSSSNQGLTLQQRLQKAVQETTF